LILFNPTNKIVEFRCGGITYIFKPKESKTLPDKVAEHAIERAKAPLVEHTPVYDSQVEFKDVVYKELPWKQLVQMASARGIFIPGDKRADVESKMEDYDGKRGTLQESSDKEEGEGA